MGRRPFYVKGALSNRPDARRLGLFYHSDEGDIYVDDGQDWAQAGGGAQIQQSARLLSYNVFVPGSLRPLTIATLANPAVGSSSILRYLEANLQSAPVGVDATNHIAARVAGSVAGSVDLALNTGVRRFALDNASPVQVAHSEQDINADNSGVDVIVYRFRPTIPISCVGFSPMKSGYTGWGNWSGIDRYGVLQDAGRNELARTAVQNHAVSDGSAVFEPDLLWEGGGVSLEADATYHIALVFPSGSGNNSVRAGRHTFTGSNLYADTVLRMRMSYTAGDDETTSWDNLEPVQGSGVGYTHNMAVFRLLGTPQGDTLSGDITLSLVGAGTVPPDPGADLNLTMRLEV